MWSPAVKRVPFLLGRFLYTIVREELRSPVSAGQDLGNFEVRRVNAYLEMMGKALLPRASESVLHAENRRLLAEANDILCLDIPPGTFVTCFYGILDPSSGRFSYANAGHSLPCRRRYDGQAVELRATGMPLGLMTGMGYENQETVLETGDSTLFIVATVKEAPFL